MMAGETGKPNLFLPPGTSPAVVAKLIVKILECKRLSCKCEISKDILHYALKILLSEDDTYLYSEQRLNKVTNLISMCQRSKNVAVQTDRRKKTSCTVQTESRKRVSCSVQTEKCRLQLQDRIKQRISSNSNKSIAIQVNFDEFINVANKENIENIFNLQNDVCNIKCKENSENHQIPDKTYKKGKLNKRISRITNFHGKTLIEKGSKKSPFIIPLTTDTDVKLTDPRLKDRECLKLWNSSLLWNALPEHENSDLNIEKKSNHNTNVMIKKVKHVTNIYPLDLCENEVFSLPNLNKTKTGLTSLQKSLWNQENVDDVFLNSIKSYSKLNEITNINFENELENDIKLERKINKLEAFHELKRREDICKVSRLKTNDCIYKKEKCNMIFPKKPRRATITEGIPVEQIISEKTNKIDHFDQCFCNLAPRQACPSDPRIKLRCGNITLDYRNTKRDLTYNPELPSKKQKLDCKNFYNSYRFRQEEISTPESASPEFSPESAGGMSDSLKNLDETKLNTQMIQNTMLHEDTYLDKEEFGMTSLKINDEKQCTEENVSSESFQENSHFNIKQSSSNVSDSLELKNLSPKKLQISNLLDSADIIQKENPENNNRSDSELPDSHEKEHIDKILSSERTNNNSDEINYEINTLQSYYVEFIDNPSKSDKMMVNDIQNRILKFENRNSEMYSKSKSEELENNCVTFDIPKNSELRLPQTENTTNSVIKHSYQKPNTLNCKRHSQDSGISEQNGLDKENAEVYSPTDELSMCSDVEMSYTPPLYPTSPERSPILNLEATNIKTSHANKEMSADKESKFEDEFQKLPEYTTKNAESTNTINTTNTYPERTEGIQNYSVMKDWEKYMPQWFQQESLNDYYKWCRGGNQTSAMHYQTFYPPYTNNYLSLQSGWICYPWWNGNAAGWH